MITRVALTLVLASSTAVAASARGTLASQTQSATVKSPMPSSSEHFLKDTLDDGFWEVEMAKLAQTNSNDDRVQRLGECLQADHEKADYEMRSILLAHNLEARDKISSARMRVIDARREVVGHQFDVAWLGEMQRTHEAAIKEFEKHQDDPDPDVRAFVVKTLPVLKEHLDKVTALRNEIEK